MLSRRPILVALRVLVLCVFGLAVARAGLFTIYRVAGTSMLDTLVDGDRILVADAPWLVHPVDVGDTVVFEVEGEVLVKRVVAGPGDTVALEDGRLWRNGEWVREEIPNRYAALDDMSILELEPFQYFVLGDNRAVSVDSRDFGPVREHQVIGRVVLRMSGEGFSTVSALTR